MVIIGYTEDDADNHFLGVQSSPFRPCSVLELSTIFTLAEQCKGARGSKLVVKNVPLIPCLLSNIHRALRAHV